MPIEADGAAYVVWPSDAKVILRTLGDEPITLLPGWTPSFALMDAGETVAVLLRHHDGRTAVWFFDQDLRFRSNQLGELPSNHVDAMTAGMAATAIRIWSELICAPTPAVDAEDLRVVEVLEPLLGELAGPLTSQVAPAQARIVRLDETSSGVIASAGLDPGTLDGLFRRDFLADILDTVQRGALTLPSPFDGGVLVTNQTLCIHPAAVAYRFVANDGTVFYAIAGLWRIRLCALYFPASGLAVFPSREVYANIMSQVGGPLEAVFLHHVLNHAVTWYGYLQAPVRQVSAVYIQEHLGHHLYNELGGLSALVAHVAPEAWPSILMINSGRSEMYGAVDEIFPELKGKVDRTPRDGFMLADFAYRSHLCLVRPTDDYVSRDLARRITGVLDGDLNLGLARSRHRHLMERGFTSVILGLRVENRTIVDQVEFFRAVIASLVNQLGRVAVVIDGHDARPGAADGTTFVSHGEHIATRSVAEVEREMAHSIQAAYMGRDDVEVISTVGASMAETIFWCGRALMFVTPWGAGLAKYRWLCNLPGLVTAGVHFSRHAGHFEMHLYDAREFMQDPTQVMFFTSDEVEDDPTAPLLVGIPEPVRVNYRVHPEAIDRRVRAALALARLGRPG